MRKKLNSPIILIIVLHAIYLPLIYLQPFATKGQPREALTAKEMLEDNNFVLPERLEGQYATKPPMTHWLIILASSFEGKVSEGASRLPSLLLSLITCLVLYGAINKSYGTKIALGTILILLCSVEWLRAALASRVDLSFTAFLVLALVLFHKAGNNCKSWNLVLSGIFLAASTMAKGPAALALFSLINLCSSFWTRKFRTTLLQISICMVPALTLPAIWYFAAYRIGGQEFLDIVMNENFRRFTGDMYKAQDPHTHPAPYLYATLILGFLPLSLITLLNIRKSILSKNNIQLELHSLYKKIKGNHFFALSVASIVIFLAIFSIPESKRSVYLLPAYPFVAFFLTSQLLKPVVQRQFNYFNNFLCYSLITLPIIVFILQPVASTLALTNKYIQILLLANKEQIFCAFILGLSLLWVFKKALPFGLKKLELPQETFLPLFKLSLLLILINYTYVLPLNKQLSAKNFCSKISTIIESKGEWFFYETDPYGINYYLKTDGHQLALSKIKKGDELLLITETSKAMMLAKSMRKIKLEKILEAQEYYNKPGVKIGLFKILKI